MVNRLLDFYAPGRGGKGENLRERDVITKENYEYLTTRYVSMSCLLTLNVKLSGRRDCLKVLLPSPV